MPSVAGWTSNSHTGTTLELTKPAGVQPGDLLLIIAGVDSTGEALQPLTGWTFAVHGGITAYNAVTFALLYRVADGTEGESITLTSAVSDDFWGWYIRVTGADPDTPIDVVQATEERSEPQVTLAGVETTVDGCLAFYAFSFDGGDGDPFSEPPGWTEEDYQETYSGSGAGSGAWGTRLMATAGSTGDVVITAGGTQDGWSGAVWAVRPAPSGTYELQRKAVGGEWETIETLDDSLYDDAPATSGGYYYRVRYTDGPWSGEVYVPYYTGGDYRIEVARASGENPDDGDFVPIAVVGGAEEDYTDSPEAGYWTYRVRRWMGEHAFPWSNEWGLNLVLTVDQAVEGVLHLAATARKSVLSRKAGALGLAGSAGKRATKALSGVLDSARSLVKSTSVQRVGSLSPAGTLARVRTYLQDLAGALSPAGLLSRLIKPSRTGTVTFTGSLNAFFSGTYEVQRKAVGGEWQTLEAPDSASYTDSPAQSGGYYYRVRYADGPWSNEVYIPYYTGGDYRIEVQRASGESPDEGDFTTIAVVGPTETDYTDSPSAGYWTYRVRRWLEDTAFPWSNEWGLNLVLTVDQAVQGVLNLAATARKSVLARKAGTLDLAAELATVIYRFYHQVVGGALEMAGAALRIPRRVLVGVLAASGQVRKDATRRLAAMLGLAGAVRKGLSVYLAGAISWAGSAASRLITGPQAILHHRLVTRVVDLTLTARRLGLTLADRVRSLRLGDDD